jgi:hypothetical protein
VATQQQIDSFHGFATRQVGSGHVDLSMDDLFELWQAEQAIDAELSDSIVAVRSALSDTEAGDTGEPFSEFITELRGRHSAPNH